MLSFAFVESRLQDSDILLAGLGEDVAVVLLNTGTGGIAQIVRVLASMRDLDAIRILSHGSSGTLNLGSTVLTTAKLDDYEPQLSAIGTSLSQDGDILVCGCNVGAGTAGQGFIESLSRHTGADMAASTDCTGSQALGDDWVLEVSTGHIEADMPFNAVVLGEYAYTLLAPGSLDPTFGNGGKVTTDIVDADWASSLAHCGLQHESGFRHTSHMARSGFAHKRPQIQIPSPRPDLRRKTCTRHADS